ncbi:hypothetical protein ACHAWF_015866 [Thalassiosira exigua]
MAVEPNAKAPTVGTNSENVIENDDGRVTKPIATEARRNAASLDSTIHDSIGENDSNNIPLRRRMGMQLSHMTDAINENLIVLRYATMSTVLLLGIYGVANTPLFYRYKSVMDIPSKVFVKRKWIHGRIVGVVKNESAGPRIGLSNATTDWDKTAPTRSDNPKQYIGLASLISTSLQKTRPGSRSGSVGEAPNSEINSPQNPIMFLFRHSSPMERLLTQSAMEKVLSISGRSPSKLLYSSANPYRNLLLIELAGVAYPPSSGPSSFLSDSLTATSTDQFPILDKLIKQKAKVSLQLLAQRAINSPPKQNNDLDDNSADRQFSIQDEMNDTAAICHLHYRRPKQWFTTTNACLEMVKEGQACINSCGLVIPSNGNVSRNASPSGESEATMEITDFNPTVKQLQNDAQFMSDLEEAEYSAWNSKRGVWSSDRIRQLRRDYVEEEEILRNKWSTRIAGWAKRGWGWIRRKI